MPACPQGLSGRLPQVGSWAGPRRKQGAAAIEGGQLLGIGFREVPDRLRPPRARQRDRAARSRDPRRSAEEVVERARGALRHTRNVRGKDLLSAFAIEDLRREIAHYCGLGERVTDQARRRVLRGEQVPNAEKIYSIFEPHTDLIKRGKVRTPMEFGHKVFLAESAHGLITQYAVLCRPKAESR
jgi:hypothetical protein